MLGPTGTGKTTFVQYFTNTNIRIVDELTSQTQEVQVFEYSMPELEKFFLIDTPGFGDTFRSDTDVLYDISRFLAAAWSSSIKLTVIVYLHRITDIRFTGASTRSRRMIHKLCGDDNLRNVVLATTFWDEIGLEKGQQRQKELAEDELFWAPLLRRGARAFRQDNGRKSAEAVLLALVRDSKQTVLQVQWEMVKERREVNDTEAAKVLEQDLTALKRNHQDELVRIKAEFQQELTRKDEKHKAELAKLIAEHKTVYQRLLRPIAALSQSKESDSGRSTSEFGSSTISGQANAVLGDVHRTYTQTFHIGHATFMYSGDEDIRLSKRSRPDSHNDTPD